MAIKDVKPTRAELIELRKRIQLSMRGHKLLKMKRDGLIIEFFNVLNKARDIRALIIAEYIKAYEKLAIAESVEGKIALKSIAMAIKHKPVVDVGSKNIMGVVVPLVRAGKITKKIDEHGYGIVGTSQYIEDAVQAYESLLEKIVEAAEIETTLRKLLDDIERVKRRVNALEFRVIPDLQETEAFIRFRLEELERENIFRLKHIKEKADIRGQ